MKTNRPVNLDLSTIKFPVTAIVSILHRVSGVVLLAGVIVLLYMLDMSLSSEDSFNQLSEIMALPLIKLIVWIVLAALAYHFVAGVRHLIMDMGIGESLEGGKLGAKISLFLSAVLIVLAGVWLW
ncbi:succinate dehydrogenase subunit C [Alteromonadaceae bacterium Bs31]|nr:succinate dehydrogenase subunit C [Alteromonadaceae bacterium Bs31]